jgi:hypothetical protein
VSIAIVIIVGAIVSIDGAVLRMPGSHLLRVRLQGGEAGGVRLEGEAGG